MDGFLGKRKSHTIYTESITDPCLSGCNLWFPQTKGYLINITCLGLVGVKRKRLRKW